MRWFTEDRLAIGFVVITALWVLVGLPIIYSPESSHKQASHSDNTPQTAANEPKGTASAPFFVQVIPTPKTAQERAQEDEDRAEKKEADRWLVRWTMALFFATVGLILATGALGYFAFRQMRDMKASTTAMINAESPRLLYLGSKFVRYENALGPAIEDPISGAIWGIIRPIFLIKNGGRTLLTINQICTEWVVTATLPESPVYADILGTAINIEQSKELWVLNQGSHIELSDAEIEKVQTREAHLWVYGFFAYLNHLTNETTTVGHGARWDPHLATFVLQAPPQYVYESRMKAKQKN